jgi:hypothetical protein
VDHHLQRGTPSPSPGEPAPSGLPRAPARRAKFYFATVYLTGKLTLDKPPRRLQPCAKRALPETMYAESRADCEAARARFEAEYQPKYSKAVG